MKRLALLLVVALAAASSHGQSVRQGAPLVLFTNQTLTNAWVAGDSVDLQSYDSVVLASIIGVGPSKIWNSADVAKVKFQWSDTGTNWADESVLSAGAASSTEQNYLPLARTVQIGMASPTVNYMERFRRQARYLRPSVQSTNVVTSGTIQFRVIQMNNQN